MRPVLLGESIAPFRLLTPALGVIPAEDEALLDADAAAYAGQRHLANWLRDIETKWTAHCSKMVDGTPRMSLGEQLDHLRKLSMQLSVTGVKVVYNKAGTLLSATILDDPRLVVDHQAYWAIARSIEEARYLTAVLNSATVLTRIAPMQPRGAGGRRHFDNLAWELPITEYNGRDALHQELAEAAAHAERIAAMVPLRARAHFTSHRRVIREALATDGIAATIDTLVARLLDG